MKYSKELIKNQAIEYQRGKDRTDNLSRILGKLGNI